VTNQYVPTFETLLSREDIIRRIIENWPVKRQEEEVLVEDALGRIPVLDICSQLTLPVVRASSRDGVAVASSRFAQGMPDTSGWVQGVDFERADTGDDFSDTYDAVITIEDVELSGEGKLSIHEGVNVAPGCNVRLAGSTVREGEMLAKAGLPLRPRDLAGLQMGGITRVTVWKKPVVAFIPSGSELIAPGTPLSRGKNIDTNSLLMRETLKEMGATPLCLPIVRDDGQEMADALNRAMPQADIIVMGGGSSKGEEDYTATLLHQQGKVLCHGAQAVPGKPLCAAIIDGKPVINLPGPFMAAYHGLEWCINGLVSHYLNRPARKRQTIEAALTKPLLGSDMVSMLVNMEVVQRRDGKGYLATPCSIRETPMSRSIMANGQYMTKLNQDIPAGGLIEVELLRGLEFIPVEEDKNL
jgi:molybdopterin molybdotransferase